MGVARGSREAGAGWGVLGEGGCERLQPRVRHVARDDVEAAQQRHVHPQLQIEECGEARRVEGFRRARDVERAAVSAVGGGGREEEEEQEDADDEEGGRRRREHVGQLAAVVGPVLAPDLRQHFRGKHGDAAHRRALAGHLRRTRLQRDAAALQA